MARPLISAFNLEPVAVERYHPEHGHEVWIAPYLVFHSDIGSVEVPGGYDARTLGVETIIVDSPTEARWTIEGTTCVARSIRPYDAVSIGLSDHPMAPAEIVARVLHGGDGPPPEHPPPEHPASCRLDLNAAAVFVDDDTQRQRAADTARAIEHDLAGETITDWRLHVPLGFFGWAPTKVPLKHRELRFNNTRFMSPAMAERLWLGSPGEWRREHIVPRATLIKEWREAGSREELVQSVWDYRFAVVGTTLEEDKQITASKCERWERYIDAGVFSVYDRLTRRDVPVAAVDPHCLQHTLPY